jgi:nicotinamidase-related amidase
MPIPLLFIKYGERIRECSTIKLGDIKKFVERIAEHQAASKTSKAHRTVVTRDFFETLAPTAKRLWPDCCENCLVASLAFFPSWPGMYRSNGRGSERILAVQNADCLMIHLMTRCKKTKSPKRTEVEKSQIGFIDCKHRLSHSAGPPALLIVRDRDCSIGHAVRGIVVCILCGLLFNSCVLFIAEMVRASGFAITARIME